VNIDPSDIGLARKVIWPDEEVEGTVKQRRVGPGGSVINPTSVIVTNMRLIIVNKTTLGFRQDYEVIPYNAIASVRMEHGIISSSVFIRVQGYDTDRGLLKGSGKQEGEIDGLRNKDAEELADYINKKIQQRLDVEEDIEKDVSKREDVDSKPGSYIYCTKCGSKNPSDAKFCGSCGAPIGK
jgi:hypothetical protein